VRQVPDLPPGEARRVFVAIHNNPASRSAFLAVVLSGMSLASRGASQRKSEPAGSRLGTGAAFHREGVVMMGDGVPKLADGRAGADDGQVLRRGQVQKPGMRRS